MKTTLHTFGTVLVVSMLMVAAPSVAEDVEITTVDGVATYPEGYQGRPHRAPEEDPFLSPSNAALILIDYQPSILQGVKNIDHEELINNTTRLAPERKRSVPPDATTPLAGR